MPEVDCTVPSQCRETKGFDGGISVIHFRRSLGSTSSFSLIVDFLISLIVAVTYVRHATFESVAARQLSAEWWIRVRAPLKTKGAIQVESEAQHAFEAAGQALHDAHRWLGLTPGV